MDPDDLSGAGVGGSAASVGEDSYEDEEVPSDEEAEQSEEDGSESGSQSGADLDADAEAQVYMDRLPSDSEGEGDGDEDGGAELRLAEADERAFLEDMRMMEQQEMAAMRARRRRAGGRAAEEEEDEGEDGSAGGEGGAGGASRFLDIDRRLGRAPRRSQRASAQSQSGGAGSSESGSAANAAAAAAAAATSIHGGAFGSGASGRSVAESSVGSELHYVDIHGDAASRVGGLLRRGLARASASAGLSDPFSFDQHMLMFGGSGASGASADSSDLDEHAHASFRPHDESESSDEEGASAYSMEPSARERRRRAGLAGRVAGVDYGGHVRVKTEPVDSTSSAPSDVPPSPVLAPSGTSGASAAALAFHSDAAASSSSSSSLLLTPDVYLASMQQQLLSNVPATILHVFGIIEDKLRLLKQHTQQQKEGGAAAAPAPAAIKTTVASRSSTGAERSGASSSPVPPKATPGVLAEQRALVAQLKEIQSVIAMPQFSASASSGSGPSSSPSATASAATSASALKVPDVAITDEESAYRAVLVQALVTVLDLCQRAKVMQSRVDATRGKAAAGGAAAAATTAAATTSGFPRWFPSERAPAWKLLVCESLLMIESTPSLSASAPDLANQLKRILVFLCGNSDTEAALLRDTYVYKHEFKAILALFGIDSEAETTPSADASASATVAGSQPAAAAVDPLTVFSEATASRLCACVFAQRSLPYPKRVQLLQSMRRIDALAQKRTATFLAFMLNNSAGTAAADQGQQKQKEKDAAAASKSKQPKDSAMDIDVSAPVSASDSEAASPDAASAASPSATASTTDAAATPLVDAAPATPAPAPRAQLVYLLYLLSVFLQVGDEELTVVMSLLGVIGQYVPQSDPVYVAARAKSVAAAAAAMAAALRSVSPPSLALAPSSIQRHASTPAPAAPSSAAASAIGSSPLFRSSSGTTIMSLLHARDAHLHSIGEAKEVEQKEAESKESESSPAPPLPSLPVLVEAATPLSSLFTVVLQQHPEYLIGFVQRHLLQNGSVAVRTHARSFLFLLWRSLPSASLRRHFFNRVFTLFIDGGVQSASTSAAAGGSAASVASAASASLSLSLYGDHARQYLTLFNTLIQDSRHAHPRIARNKDAAERAPSPASTAAVADQGAVAMEMDGEGASVAASEMSMASSGAGAASAVPLSASRGSLDDPDCVDGLTHADCSSAIRRLLDCMAAQAASFTSHALSSTYTKLATLFDLTPKQHYLQDCLCSICNSQASALPTDHSSASSRGGAAGSLASRRYAIAASMRVGGGDPTADSGWSTSNLKDLSVEAKFTHCSRAMRLASLQTIHTITFKISGVPVPAPSSSGASGSNPSGGGGGGGGGGRHRVSLGGDGSSLAGTSLKQVKRLDVYFSARVGVELAALPLPPHILRQPSSGPASASVPPPSGNAHWTLACSLTLASGVREASIVLPLPLHASALLLHFASFHEDFSTLGEAISCPRCHVPVASRTSQCSRCRETVGQCARCRAIDYEHPDAFQCGECSHSRYGNLSFTLKSKASSHVAAITNESQRKAAMTAIAAVQERIAKVLGQDMERAREKIDALWRQGASRIRLDHEPAASAQQSRAAAAKKAPREPRLDLRQASHASSLGAPATSTLLRNVYETEAAAAHNRLTALYAELQLNRTELFLYLHKSPFYMERKIAQAAGEQDDAFDSNAPSSSPRRLISSSCYSCAKHFLLLGAAMLHELNAECLLGAHLAGGDARATSDFDLLLYYLQHVTSVGSDPNPFALEAAFIGHTASRLLTLLVQAHDQSGSGVATQWLHAVLEKHVVHIIRGQQIDGAPADSMAASADANPDRLSALMSPLLSLCRTDLKLMRRQPSARPFHVAGTSARFQSLFRVLLVALYADGARSPTVSQIVIAPILTLLCKATNFVEIKPKQRSARKEKASRAAAKSAAASGSSSSVSAALSESARQMQLLEQLSRHIRASGENTTAEERQATRDSLRALQRQMQSAAGRSSDHAERERFMQSLSSSYLAPRGLASSPSSGSANLASPSPPSSLLSSGLSLRRVSNLASPSGPSAARRSSFQRSPGMHPSSSPGSSRLGPASRVPTSAPSTAQQSGAPASSSSSSSPLPPLSLSPEQLTVQSLANQMLNQVCALWSDQCSAIDLPSWLRASSDTSASTLAFFDSWTRDKAERSMRARTPSPSPQAAAAAAATGPSPAQLNSARSTVMDEVASLGCAAPFLVADLEGCMDLTTIRSKLLTGSYASHADFMTDVQSIRFQCEAMSPEQLPLANQLVEAIETRMKSVLEREQTATPVAAAVASDARPVDRLPLLRAAFARLRSGKHSPSIGPYPIQLSGATSSPVFALRSLLLCPLSLTIRQHTAQLLWNLAYPSLSSKDVNSLEFKPTRKSKRKRASANKNTEATPSATATAVAASGAGGDAVVDVRAFALVRALLTILRDMDASDGLYSLSFFTAFTHLLHATGAPASDSPARLKHSAVVRGVLSLLMSRFHAELQSIENEERSIDFISHIHAVGSVAHSSVGAHADVHRHHCLYGVSMLLSCLLDDPQVLAYFKRARLQSRDDSGQSAQLLAPQTMSFFLRIRGLMLVHSKWLDRSSAYLAHIVNRLFSTDSDADKRATLQAYVYALSSGSADQASAVSSPTGGSVSGSGGGNGGASPTLNPHITTFILERLCDLIKPPQLEQQCMVTFRKASTQEEYIRGNMRRAPYLSSSFLPPAAGVGGGASSSAPSSASVLMRDVRDAICTQLKLPREENMIELLVAGKIVGLDVPLLQLYKKWFAEQYGEGHAAASSSRVGGHGRALAHASPSMSPHSSPDDGGGDSASEGEGGDASGGALLLDGASKSTVLLAGDVPMQVTYRLTGLDGEATEEKIDSLPDDEVVQLDPEQEFALAGALGESGLRALLRNLDQAANDAEALKEDVEVRLVGLLLKLLGYATKIGANREALLHLQAPAAESASARATAVPFCFRVLLDKLIVTLRAADSAKAGAAATASAGSAAANAAGPAAAPSPVLSLSTELVSVLSALLVDFATGEHGQAELQSIESVEQSPTWRVPSEQLHALLSCLSLPSVRAHSDLYHRLLAIVPMLSFGQRPLLAAVEAHFTQQLDPAAFDTYRTPESEAAMEALAILTEEIPRGTLSGKQGSGAVVGAASQTVKLTPSPIGAAVRDYFRHSGLTQRLFTYLLQAAAGEPKVDSSSNGGDANMAVAPPAPAPTKSKKRARDVDDGDLTLALNQLVGRAALPFVLRMLTGLVYGHPSSQSLAVQLSALGVLQKLEGMASSSRVGPLAESLLTALALNNDEVSAAVADLRGLKKQQKKQKALDQRAKMLAKMGFVAGGKAAAKAAQQSGAVATAAHLGSFAGGLESLDESGAHRLKCSVCLEGYAYKPNLPLGFYCYNSQIVLGMGSMDDSMSGGSGGDESAGVTTVTHFNLIHYSCHREACRGDKKLKPPKSEWEGATIRNQHTLCNNLFPILQPPPSVTQAGAGAGAAAESQSGAAASASSYAQAIMAAVAGASPPSAGGPSSSSGSGGSSSSSSSLALLNPASPLWDSADMDASLEQYQAAVEQYWQIIPFHQCFVAARLELIAEDTRALLSRFAMQESFSSVAKGGGKESNIQMLPYLVQMTIFLAQCATQTSVRERVEGHVHTAMQVLGAIDTSAGGSATGAARSPSSSSSSGRGPFSSMPFLNADFPAFGSGAAAAAMAAATSRSGSGSQWPSSSGASASGSGSGSAPGPVASLKQLLTRSSLDGLASSSMSLGSERIRGSLYADPTDYLEYLMVMSLSYCSAAQWDACKYSMLWRLIVQAKDALALELAANEGEGASAAGGESSSAVAAATAAAASADGDHDMGVASASASAPDSAPAAPAAAAAVPSENEAKEGDSKSASSSSSSLTSAQRELVSHTQLEVLRPILLFWSLIDSLHHTLSPPFDASYSASHSDAFLASTSSAWYRRWRRCFTRAAALATFRSILRREEDILTALTGPVLEAYERNVQAGSKSLADLFDAVGATGALTNEGFTLPQLLDAITQVTIAPAQ